MDKVMVIVNDFDTTVKKALDEIDPKWKDYPGVIVCGSHTPHDLEDMLEIIKDARIKDLPFLGLCMGFQLSIVEFARNVLGLVEANTTEIDPLTSAPVVSKLPELRVGMRPVKGKMESFWHNFAFNEDYLDLFSLNGWNFVKSEVIVEGRLMGPKYFKGTQYHPEYQSTKERPHPILKEFIDAARMAM